MQPRTTQPGPIAAVLTLAEIAAAIEAFNRGESNVFDALDAILEAVEGHRADVKHDPRRDAA
jgi:hypothetical protein